MESKHLIKRVLKKIKQVLSKFFLWCATKLEDEEFEGELHSLDYTILRFILPRLRAFRRQKLYTFPADLQNFGESNKEAAKKWHIILEKMEKAIELFLENDGIFITKSKSAKFEIDKKKEEEFKEGWDLFVKYFFSLWD